MKLSAIIPAYNEESTIEEVIRKVQEVPIGYRPRTKSEGEKVRI